MTKVFRAARGAVVFLLAGMAATACSDPFEPGIEASFQVQSVGDENPVLVMTQNVVPPHVMDAHFEGVIIADGEGCLRLEDEDGPTVVWPVHYTGEVTEQGVMILDDDGNEVGPVGGMFDFGGGSIPELLASLGFTDGDRDTADALCPGSYWIVAP
jgi:hypothetical protein